MSNWVGRCLCLEYEVEQVSANLGMHDTEVSHILILWVMELYLVQETGGSPMSGLYTFQFYLLVKSIENHYASIAILA